ncbi:MAG: methyltransferase domain-containing protein [Syntrophorhabdaceae bacterium]|nr:methyltransferase domain-containing protein [Syntrophorhabdaceae bacterium]
MSERLTRYEEYAHVQRLSAVDLLEFTRKGLNEGRIGKILEPGCGTGLYTRELIDAFPHATIEGIDISETMVRQARERTVGSQAYFRTANAEEVVSGEYDLITSNATFQWFHSFDRTIQRMSSILHKAGSLTFTYFGPKTFAELDDALLDTREDGETERTAASRFLSRDKVEASLSAVFSETEVTEQTYQQEFNDLSELLRSIRHTGTGGGGLRKGWSAGRLSRVERAYRERFGGIRATYQVFFCRGAGFKGEVE